MMKLTRFILVCTLLLLASSPLFALPQCKDCVNNVCTPIPGASIEPCTYVLGVCENYTGNCVIPHREPVLADWTIASIEVSRPVLDAKVVATPAGAAAVRTIEVAEQK
jgi:hypothetical protein